MNSFTQTEDFLLGSIEAVENLSKKENARILCISDSHGNSELFGKLIKIYGKDCDGLIFCGDGIKDIGYLIKKSQSDSELLEVFPPVVAFVQGNNDPSSYPVSSDFYLKCPEKQILNVCGTKILISHGHYQSVDFGLDYLAFEAQLSECKVIFYGHTHVPAQDYVNGYRIYNPGSISRPRGYNRYPSFAILTIQKNVIDTAFIEIKSPYSEELNCGTFIPLS